jgi:hypothetical protein
MLTEERPSFLLLGLCGNIARDALRLSGGTRPMRDDASQLYRGLVREVTEESDMLFEKAG